MIQLSIQQSFAYRRNASGRRHLLNKIISSLDQILEFDPKTGGLKRWAWYLFSVGLSVHVANSLTGQRMTSLMAAVFPYATLLGIVRHTFSFFLVACVPRCSGT
jgi:hypothetical protein